MPKCKHTKTAAMAHVQDSGAMINVLIVTVKKMHPTTGMMQNQVYLNRRTMIIDNLFGNLMRDCDGKVKVTTIENKDNITGTNVMNCG